MDKNFIASGAAFRILLQDQQTVGLSIGLQPIRLLCMQGFDGMPIIVRLEEMGQAGLFAICTGGICLDATVAFGQPHNTLQRCCNVEIKAGQGG
ncbi:hypothetical protein D3C81_853180 [compost metagenome]